MHERNLIQSQTQLLSLNLYSIPSNALDALKPCSNTISIGSYDCDLTNISLLDRLGDLTRFEPLQFCFCRGMMTQTFHPLRIKSLGIYDLLPQNVGSHLENLVSSVEDLIEEKEVYGSFMKYCDFFISFGLIM